MTTILGVALIILGLAIGFIVAWAFGAGASTGLIIGVLLIIAGAIVGFVVEWLIDESVRKNRELHRQLEEQRGMPMLVEGSVVNDRSSESVALAEVLRQLHAMQETRAAVTAGEGSNRDNETLTEVLRQHNEELHQLGEKIAAKDVEMESLRRKFETYQKSHPDDLTQVKGIGPVFQRKLRDIGFNSFEQLATANPAQIRRMLDIKNWQRVDIESWVQQARDWAEHT